MHADKARRLVLEHKARSGMAALYQKIEVTASAGGGSCVFACSQCSDIQAELLCKDGYIVEPVNEDASFQARQTGWRVIWLRQ